jgi:hypothetical protein
MSGYGLDGIGVGLSFLAGIKSFSVLHNVQTGFAIHPASYALELSLGLSGRVWS